MVPSSPDDIWEIAKRYSNDGDPEFAKRYMQQAYDELDELEEFERKNKNFSYLKSQTPSSRSQEEASQPNLYQAVSENAHNATSAYNYLPQEDSYSSINNNEISEEMDNLQRETSMWDRLRGAREGVNNFAGHIGRNIPSYAATVPFLAAGAGLGLGSLAFGNRKKRRKR